MHAVFMACPIKLSTYAVVRTFQWCEPSQLPEPRPVEEDRGIACVCAGAFCSQKKRRKQINKMAGWWPAGCWAPRAAAGGHIMHNFREKSPAGWNDGWLAGDQIFIYFLTASKQSQASKQASNKQAIIFIIIIFIILRK